MDELQESDMTEMYMRTATERVRILYLCGHEGITTIAPGSDMVKPTHEVDRGRGSQIIQLARQRAGLHAGGRARASLGNRHR